MGEVILIRHGETEWSRQGRYAGRTEVRLTAAGVAAGTAIAAAIAGRDVVAAFTSPLGRALQTAALAGLPGVVRDADLAEWDYGGYEGMTAEQIQRSRPGWDLWRDGVVPGDADHPGERLQQVGARADAVLDRIRPLLSSGDVAVVSHGHLVRVLAARWLGLAPCDGRMFRHPDPGALGALGTEDGRAVVCAWNVPGPPRGA